MPLSSPGLPVSLVLGGRRCLVVGGGAVAGRKARALLDAGATVTMVAPRFVPESAALGALHEERRYRAGEAAAYHLAIAATGVAEVDAAVAADADAAGVLVNVADDPERCSFILPAVHRSGAVSIAVSTDGHSPALASWLRDRVAAEYGGELGALAGRVGLVREALRAAGASSEGRDWRGLIEALVASPTPEVVADQWLERELATPLRG